MSEFKLCSVADLDKSFTELIGRRYALVTASSGNELNIMTASWGSMGIMWNKNVVNIVVRPSRYTYKFLCDNDYFALNFLTEGNEDIYKFCGSKSGRDYDKVTETGLIPIELDNSVFAFDKSKYVFVCKKLYAQPMGREFFVDNDYGRKTYPDDDIHTMFIAEIEKVYVK